MVLARAAEPAARAAAAAAQEPPRDEVPLTLQTRGNSVDVRGQRADEALRMVEDFLDRAALEGTDTIFVIHGHGTGALRKAVREYLATSGYVARFRPGGNGEGGDGVSVVSLRG
jgi:DNA mismatch repair protein MutS2